MMNAARPEASPRRGPRMHLGLGGIFILPALLILGVTMVYPLMTILLFSTQKVGLAAAGGGEFVGLDNFRRALTSSSFLDLLSHSLFVSLGAVVICVVLGMALALLLNQTFPGRALARSLVILPWAMPAFVAAFAWRYIFDYQYGPVNNLWLTVFPDSTGIAPLSDPSQALPVATLIYAWKGLPWATIVLLAGLQVVPHDQREAARVDGANRVQEFFYVVLPSMRFVLQITITLLFIWNFNWFDMMWLLTRGGPGTATETLPIEVYQRAFQAFDAGYASALGVIILIVVVAGAALVMRLTSRRADAEARA
jgi:multiple sugar transport system permease protein